MAGLISTMGHVVHIRTSRSLWFDDGPRIMAMVEAGHDLGIVCESDNDAVERGGSCNDPYIDIRVIGPTDGVELFKRFFS